MYVGIKKLRVDIIKLSDVRDVNLSKFCLASDLHFPPLVYRYINVSIFILLFLIKSIH